MTRHRQPRRILGFAVCAVLLWVLCRIPGYGEALFHFLGGSIFSLLENLPAVSIDPEIWIPGLVAFGFAVVTAHIFLRSRAIQRNRPWRLGTTLCLGLILPVLFIISFIIPGVLLQIELLREITWFE